VSHQRDHGICLCWIRASVTRHCLGIEIASTVYVDHRRLYPYGRCWYFLTNVTTTCALLAWARDPPGYTCDYERVRKRTDIPL
jgi:hypothetical protein